MSFWIDTGTSIHISPIQTYFLSIKPIAPRPVKGIGGSSVLAIGIRDIQVCAEKGTQIKLQDVLYISVATVHLISVRCLTWDSNAMIHFTNSMCWITDKLSGTTIAHGHHSHKETFTHLLYTHSRLNTISQCIQSLPLTHGIGSLGMQIISQLLTWKRVGYFKVRHPTSLICHLDVNHVFWANRPKHRFPKCVKRGRDIEQQGS